MRKYVGDINIFVSSHGFLDMTFGLSRLAERVIQEKYCERK
jgi:hypothetical protein